MDVFLNYFLPIYLFLFFAVAFVGRTLVVWKRTGINAYALMNKAGVEGVIARYFRLLPLLSIVTVLMFVFAPDYYPALGVISWLESLLADSLGIVLLIVSFIWISIAQSQMKDSWRIGIDESNKTELVHEGLFQYSRNPIFLGMILNVIGLFLILPNALTLSILLLSYAMIRLQIALEEEFLLKMHGANYQEYLESVGRWFGKPR